MTYYEYDYDYDYDQLSYINLSCLTLTVKSYRPKTKIRPCQIPSFLTWSNIINPEVIVIVIVSK
jgi:hypothetical protein